MFRVTSPDGRFDRIGALKASPTRDESTPLARVASIRHRASPGGAARLRAAPHLRAGGSLLSEVSTPRTM